MPTLSTELVLPTNEKEPKLVLTGGQYSGNTMKIGFNAQFISVFNVHFSYTVHLFQRYANAYTLINAHPHACFCFCFLYKSKAKAL